MRNARVFLPSALAHQMNRAAALSRCSRWFDERPEVVHLQRPSDLYEHVIDAEGLDAPIDYLEFGVAAGRAWLWWLEHVKNPEARFHGFDCFEGLPEDWGAVRQGTFTQEGKPPGFDDARGAFQIGLFQETLFPFLSCHTLERRIVLHIDADLYSSTLFVLTALAPLLKKDDVIIFDEFGSISTPEHEFRAFEDFCSAYNLEYQALATAFRFKQMAIRLTRDVVAR